MSQSEIDARISAVQYGEAAIYALIHEDNIDDDGDEDDTLSEQYREDPEQYLKDKFDPSFEWLGESGIFHDGGETEYRFKVNDKIYEGNGLYSSWGGSCYPDLSDFYEVRPVQKTITVYERVK